MQDEFLYWIFYDVVQYYNGKLNENKNNTKKNKNSCFFVGRLPILFVPSKRDVTINSQVNKQTI